MRERHELSKVLFIIFKFACFQGAFWFLCFRTLQTDQSIEAFAVITILGPMTIMGIIPFLSAQTVNRRTMLGYARSWNGIFFIHVGLGLMLALQLFTDQVERFSIVLGLLAMIFGTYSASVRSKKYHDSITARKAAS